jgi:hypothetical protein
MILLMIDVRSQTTNQNNVALQSADSIQISALANAFYQAISFQNVDSNKLDSLNKFFIPTGQLIANTGKEPFFLTVKQYIDGTIEQSRKERLNVFEMNETCSKTDIFGKIANRFSTYRLHGKTALMDFNTAGIYTMQFIKQDNTWLLTSIAWDKESPNSIIPSKYTCK